MSLKSFNPSALRVECAVCKRRRPLREMEISQLHHKGIYHCYQFCSDACERNANDEQKRKVREADPINMKDISL